jgi:hypothetical protein
LARLLIYPSAIIKRLTFTNNNNSAEGVFMHNAIFSTASDSFIVAHVLHAGPVMEFTSQSTKSDNTHYFRLTTTHGTAFCHFKNEESARKSRGLLGVMLGTVKPHLFRSKGDSIDIASIVSFGRPVKLKAENEGDKYGIPVTLAGMTDRSATIWLTFQTEESAKNVRKALWASVMSYYTPADKTAAAPAAVAAEAEVHSDAQVELACA